jgi:hypothetical protein
VSYWARIDGFIQMFEENATRDQLRDWLYQDDSFGQAYGLLQQQYQQEIRSGQGAPDLARRLAAIQEAFIKAEVIVIYDRTTNETTFHPLPPAEE